MCGGARDGKIGVARFAEVLERRGLRLGRFGGGRVEIPLITLSRHPHRPRPGCKISEQFRTRVSRIQLGGSVWLQKF